MACLFKCKWATVSNILLRFAMVSAQVNFRNLHFAQLIFWAISHERVIVEQKRLNFCHPLPNPTPSLNSLMDVSKPLFSFFKICARCENQKNIDCVFNKASNTYARNAKSISSFLLKQFAQIAKCEVSLSSNCKITWRAKCEMRNCSSSCWTTCALWFRQDSLLDIMKFITR